MLVPCSINMLSEMNERLNRYCIKALAYRKLALWIPSLSLTAYISHRTPFPAYNKSQRGALKIYSVP